MKFAAKHDFIFTIKDENGFYQFMQNCCMQPLDEQMCVYNLLIKRNAIEKHTYALFDYNCTSTHLYNFKTLFMSRSSNYDFPFLSVQPKYDIHPPQLVKAAKNEKQKFIRDADSFTTHTVFAESVKTYEAYKSIIKNIIDGKPNLYLELNNFFLYFTIDCKNRVPTTQFEKLQKEGLAIIEILKKV